MSRILLTVTTGGTAGAPTLTVTADVGPDFYGGSPVLIATTALDPGEGFWLNVETPTSSPMAAHLTVGGTDDAMTLGISAVIAGTDTTISLLAPVCFEVDYIDAAGFMAPLVLTATLGPFSTAPSSAVPLASPLAIMPSAAPAEAHVDFEPSAGVGGLTWALGPCCVHEDSRLELPTGESRRIAEIRAGDQVLDEAGHPVRVLANVRFDKTERRWIRIARGALGDALPRADLLMRAGHPILVDGREMLVERLIDGDRIAPVEIERAGAVHTLCTARRGFVRIEGVPVATWSAEAWENFVHNDERGRRLAWSKQ